LEDEAAEPHDPERCPQCGARRVVSVSDAFDLAAEHAAIAAGTHEPAVDDFGHQYLARVEHR
jgi:hypothetical protein